MHPQIPHSCLFGRSERRSQGRLKWARGGLCCLSVASLLFTLLFTLLFSLLFSLLRGLGTLALWLLLPSRAKASLPG